MRRWSQAKGKELQKSGKDKSLEGPNKQERPEEAHPELSQGRENQGRPRTERDNGGNSNHLSPFDWPLEPDRGSGGAWRAQICQTDRGRAKCLEEHHNRRVSEKGGRKTGSLN